MKIVIRTLEKIFGKKKNIIQVPVSEIETEYERVELFIKPWLYKFNFTFSNRNNPCYSTRDCYKEATGKCLLEKNNTSREVSTKIYNQCLGLKKYLKQYPEPMYTLPFISSMDGKEFFVSDGQHRLCVAIYEKIKIYVNAEIPKSMLEKFKIENDSEI